MKKITTTLLLLGGIFAYGQDASVGTVIAGTSFEEPAAVGGSYTDTGDAAVAHDLVNNAGEPLVDYVAVATELGFDAVYEPYDTPGSGLTDGDFVGVTDFTGAVGAYTDGTQGYQISDSDGNMITTFDLVDMDGFTNNEVSLDLFINSTGYEGDGTVNESGSDRIRVYVVDITDGSEYDLLDTTGSDINDLAIEGAWQNLSVSLPDNAQAELVFEVRTNSSSEAVYMDNVVFTGEEVPPAVSFTLPFNSVPEDGGSIEVEVEIAEAPAADVTVDVVLVSGGTAAEGADFTYAATQTLTFPSGSSAPQALNIPIINNTDDGSDVFFVLELQNPLGVSIDEDDLTAIYILDDDTVVPTGDPAVLDINFVDSYLVDASGTAEITAYDPDTQRLFVTNSNSIEILDFSDPANISSIASVDVSGFGDGVQSVAVNNGIVAAAIAADPATDPGVVLFMDTDGGSQSTVTVGALPDMLTFTPDGTKVLVANEGEPNGDYSVDPEGSIAVIDVTGGLGSIVDSDVTIVDFNAFDGTEAALNAANIRIYGPGANASQDLEPEYITVASDSQTAYVVCQENNAYAVVDLNTNTVTDLFSFGLKDHSLPQNSLDVSDETDFVFNASWPIFGMYMPDAIDFYEVGGTGYIVTANEGDAREYDTYVEEFKIDDDEYTLDPAVFSDIDILELESNLAEINVSIASGDTDGDGEFEEIHVYGARSFSIYNADTGAQVFDSGNDFEVITAADPVYGGIFNASNSNNNFKNRSDNKGPEPEGVVVAEIGTSFYAFVLLERIGGFMTYDITDPNNPVFIEYNNSRGAVPGDDESGDLAPEGVVYVSAEQSPTGIAHLVISNEESATLSIWSLDNVLSVDEFQTADDKFTIHPNPTTSTVFFSTPGDYTIYDIQGRLIVQLKQQAFFDASGLKSGVYLIRNENGLVQRLIKQ
jgi:hypothetical protein